MVEFSLECVKNVSTSLLLSGTGPAMGFTRLYPSGTSPELVWIRTSYQLRPTEHGHIYSCKIVSLDYKVMYYLNDQPVTP